MTGRFGWSLLVLLAHVLGTVHTARVLGVYPVPAKSHYSLFTSLFKELAARGHEVTVISGFPLDKPLANYTNIEIPIDFMELMKIFGTTNMFDMKSVSPFTNILKIFQVGEKLSEMTYENQKVVEMIRLRKQFDVIIIEDFANEALAGLAHVFNAHLIYFSSTVGFFWTNDLVGNPSSVSYIPDTFSSYSDRMTLTERFYNILDYITEELYYHLYFIPRQDAVMRRYLPGISNLPHLTEINAKTSLVLVNSIPGISYPRPLLPNMVLVGGLHIKAPKPLPQDLKNFLDSATEGAIYFSMGSNLKSADFPLQLRQTFMKVFSNMKQKVLWKFELDDMPGKPTNVLIGKWLPQNDIMAHPNLKLFITHGGLLSSQEALSHGVPIVGIPVLGDQRLNMKNSEIHGFGILLEFSNISDTSVEWALKEVLENPRYTERAKAASRIFHDQPQTPMERAVYWTEYVVRHKGAPHLRSAAVDLAWYQYLLLDVIAVILLAVLTVVSVIVFLFKRLFCTRKQGAIDLTKKTR